MFSVHGVRGQTFRGSLERLLEVPGVFPRRPARGPGREEENWEAEFGRARRREVAMHPDARYAQAAAAYAQSMPPKAQREPVMRAYQVMSREVFCMRPEDTVAVACQQLAERRVRQAPVVEASLGVVGLVSDRELLTAIHPQDGNPAAGFAQLVREVMISPIICADPVTDIRRIARVLLDSGLSALPVVDDAGALVGIVSRGDFLRAALADPPLSLWV